MLSRFRRFLHNLGPGFVTGASDDDPSGIATYAQAGAGFGFSTLWSILFTLPLMIAVQEMSARIAMVTGKGLIENIRQRHAKPTVIGIACLLFIANTINIGADLGMMASAAQIFWHLPFAFWLLLAAVATLLLEIFTSYATYARYLKWLTLSLFAYIATAFFVHIHWGEALRATIIPHFQWSSKYLLILVALLGTTISPYLFFWQANQEVEEELVDGRIHGTKRSQAARCSPRELRLMRFDVTFGMIFSNVISWFIILTTATALFFSLGYTEILSADQAAQALTPFAGPFAVALFALGIIGTGLLTIPILSGTAAYAFSEVFGFREGLSQKWWQAKAFYGVIIISVLIGGAMNFFGIQPFRALIYSAVVNALIAPPILWMIIRLGSDKKVMGTWVNGGWVKCFAWLTFIAMIMAPLAWIWFTFSS